MTDQDMDALVDNIVNSMSLAAVHQTLAVLYQENHAYYQYQVQCATSATSAAKQHLKQLVQCVNAPPVTSMRARCVQASNAGQHETDPELRRSERVQEILIAELEELRGEDIGICDILEPNNQQGPTLTKAEITQYEERQEEIDKRIQIIIKTLGYDPWYR